MLDFSTGKTGTLSFGSTSGAGWTEVTLYDCDGTVVSSTNRRPIDSLVLYTPSSSGDCWVRINGNTGAALFLPAGSSWNDPGNQTVNKVEIIRNASTDVSGFYCAGKRST